MIEKLECTCIEAYKTRKMRDPNCCACSCDHNDLIEQLAKANEDYKALFSAFESCQDELKESNEHVKKLEQINLELAANVEACCELTEMDMGAAIERLFEIDNTESKALLNKFAIEKKIEALESFVLPYQQGVTKEYVKGGYGSLVLKAAQAEIEQLRKEQGSD
ncbi:hypothetical protein MTsDn5_08070 [Alteromonas gracilis]|uniref:hypothetical protein n=1 Tax=Alteromonas gracilis TaxID=1479524 RepID=UPI0036F31308